MDERAAGAEAPGGGAPAREEAPSTAIDLLGALRHDRSVYRRGARLLRALRMARILAPGSHHRDLAGNPALQRHLASVAAGDRLFWLSHRSYLVAGLSPRDRTAAALAHYGHEATRLGPAYLRAVYLEGGLALWAGEVGGTQHELRLMPGSDVLHEGGLSIVLLVDGERVCVLSFSWVPARVILGRGPGLVPFATRIQLTTRRDYQQAFHRAFGHTAASRLCVAALAGMAQALGHQRIVGIRGDRHPARAPERRRQFETAYDRFWASLGGRPAGRFGYLVPLPFEVSPLEAMPSGHRRRAQARRGHMEAVARSAAGVIAGFRPEG